MPIENATICFNPTEHFPRLNHSAVMMLWLNMKKEKLWSSQVKNDRLLHYWQCIKWSIFTGNFFSLFLCFLFSIFHIFKGQQNSLFWFVVFIIKRFPVTFTANGKQLTQFENFSKYKNKQMKTAQNNFYG